MFTVCLLIVLPLGCHAPGGNAFRTGLEIGHESPTPRRAYARESASSSANAHLPEPSGGRFQAGEAGPAGFASGFTQFDPERSTVRAVTYPLLISFTARRPIRSRDGQSHIGDPEAQRVFGAVTPVAPDYYLTAAHVVNPTDPRGCRILYPGKRIDQSVPAVEVWRDEALDLCLLWVEGAADGASAKPINGGAEPVWSPAGLPTSSPVRVGQTQGSRPRGRLVNPLYPAWKLAERWDDPTEEGRARDFPAARPAHRPVGRVVWHTIPIQAGDSGSALMTPSGQIIAINVATLRIEHQKQTGETRRTAYTKAIQLNPAMIADLVRQDQDARRGQWADYPSGSERPQRM